MTEEQKALRVMASLLLEADILTLAGNQTQAAMVRGFSRNVRLISLARLYDDLTALDQ